MAWSIVDEKGIEDQIQAMGDDLWQAWSEVKPHLIEDPHPANHNLRFDQTFGDIVWVDEERSVYVAILTDNEHVYLMSLDDIHDDPA